MKDKFGREIDYLRVSITTRCNLNCIYCGKADCEKKEQELPAETICAIVRDFAVCGIKKVRVTGGEPLVRADVCDIVRGIRAIPEIETIGLTTNGVLLEQYAQPLFDAGLDSVNVSLDSTDGSTYRHLTGADVLDKVLRGIKAAQSAGLSPIRLNAVLMKGVNDDGAKDLIALAKDSPIDVRFIELMPFSGVGEDNDRRVTGDEILRQFSFLRPLDTQEAATARYYTADGFQGRIGLISPVSHQFCDQCRRVRLLSDGSVKPCLAFDDSYDLTAYENDPAARRTRIREIIFQKPAGHNFGGDKTTHGLNRTGG